MYANTQFVGNTSRFTNEVNDPLKEDAQYPKSYGKNSKEDRDTLGFVLNRFMLMKQARSRFDRNWATYMNLWDAPFASSVMGESFFNAPLEQAVISHFRSDSGKRPPKFFVEPQEVIDPNNLKALRKVLDHQIYGGGNMANGGYMSAFDDEELNRCIFGTGVLATDFHMEYRLLTDESMEGDFQKHVMNVNKFIRKRSVDPRMFFLDENCSRIDDAVDCIEFWYVPADAFRSLKYDPSYKNIDEVSASYTQSDVMRISNKERTKRNVVEIMRYTNKWRDKEVVIANRSKVIRTSAIRNPLHILPYAVTPLIEHPSVPQGKGFVELCLPFKNNLNIIESTYMEAVKRSNNTALFIGGGLKLEDADFAFDNTMYQFNGQLQGNFEQVSGTPPNQAMVNYKQGIPDDIAMYVGINLKAMIDGSGTAYQTAVQQEMSTKIMNNLLKTRDKYYQRDGELTLAMVQTHYSKTSANKFYPVSTGADEQGNETMTFEENNTPPTIPLKGEQLVDGKFEQGAEDSFFEVSPDLLRGQVSIRVETNFNASVLQSQMRVDTLSGLNQIVQIEQMAKTSESIAANKDDLIIRTSKDYNLDLDCESSNPIILAEQEKLMQMADMLQGMGDMQPQAEAEQTGAPAEIP